jgi:hypothetical protein
VQSTTATALISAGYFVQPLLVAVGTISKLEAVAVFAFSIIVTNDSA